MKCKLHNPHDDLEAYWVHWPSVLPLWQKNDYHPLDPARLKPAYHNLWFADIEGKRSHFQIGAISFDEEKRMIMFSNGRHRTLLLSTLMDRVPLALLDCALREPEIQKGLLAPIERSDSIELPQLPVLERAGFGWRSRT